MNNEKVFFTWRDISELTGVGKTKSYELIAKMNKELESQGYIVAKAGIVPKSYAQKRLGLLLD